MDQNFSDRKSEKIRNAIREWYGFSPDTLVRTKFGTADCYIGTAGNRKIFVKIYLKKYPPEQIGKEIRACRLLTAAQVPVSEYLPNREGQYISQGDIGVFTLQKYVEGITYEKFQTPLPVLFQSARLLGRIHTALAQMEGLSADFTPEWIARANGEAALRKTENVLHKAEQLPAGGFRDRILEDCRWKLQAIPRARRWRDCFAGLSRKNSHGDYNNYQWICKDETIQAVVDFGSCGNLPAIWELARSYTCSAPECRDGDRVNLDTYVRYLRCYLEKEALNRTDVSAGFRFYYYTLAASMYGYQEYMEDLARGKENPVIHFAFWRTAVCRYLETQGERLDERIGKMLGHTDTGCVNRSLCADI